MGSVRGKSSVYFYYCSCTKSSGPETTLCFHLPGPHDSRKEQKTRGLVCAWPLTVMFSLWASGAEMSWNYPQISLPPLLDSIKSLLKGLRGLWSVLCAESPDHMALPRGVRDKGRPLQAVGSKMRIQCLYYLHLIIKGPIFH